MDKINKTNRISDHCVRCAAGRPRAAGRFWAVVLAAVFALALVLSACTTDGTGVAAPPASRSGFGVVSGSEAPPAGPVRIAAVLPQNNDELLAESERHAKAALDELAAAGEAEFVLYTGADAAGLASALEKALAFAPDVVLLWPLWEDALAPAAEAVQRMGAKLVLFGNGLQFLDAAARMVGDNEAIGRWTGEYLVKKFGAGAAESGKTVGYLRFMGDGGPVSQIRSAAMDEALAALGYGQVFEALDEDIITEVNGTAAKTALLNWLEAANGEQRRALEVIVAQSDVLVDGIAEALGAWAAQHSEPLRVRLVCGVGGRRETLELFDAPEDGREKTRPDFLTYFYSPTFLREAVALAYAVARGLPYDGNDITGQLFTLPTIEIDKTTVNAYRASHEYAQRYALPA